MCAKLTQLGTQEMLEIEIKRRTNQMIAVHAVTSVVGTSLDLNTTLEVALLVTMDMIGADASNISLLDEDTGELVMRAQRGWTQDFTTRNPIRIPLSEGMFGQVIAGDDVVVFENRDDAETFAFPRLQNERFRSIAMAPMHSRGEIIGIISVMSNRPGSFDQDIVNVLRVVADTVGVALDNARLYARSVENENRLTAIINSTADGIIATNHTGDISLVNHAAGLMMGIKQKDLLGLPLREAPLLPRIRDALLLALASRIDETHRSFQVTLDDERIIAGLVSPVYNANQVEPGVKMDAWVIVLQDVTYQRQEQIARTKFIQAAAHDMRNPLSVTQSALTMLDMRLTEKDDKIVEIISIARGGIRRLRNLIDNLSDLEKIESGYNFNLIEISLLDILHEVGLESHLLLQEKSITFIEDIAPNLPTIKIDPQWFKRALHNYLENAGKYTQVGGEVKLKVFVKDTMVYIEVQDNGPGISQSAQKRLYERFYRVQEHKGIEGSGLGLAIVKSVAEAHSGQVYIHSAPGKGSTFGFKLPTTSDPTP